jgi:hypothetical protein
MNCLKKIGVSGLIVLLNLTSNNYANADLDKFLPKSEKSENFNLLSSQDKFYYDWNAKKGILKVDHYPHLGWNLVINRDTNSDNDKDLNSGLSLQVNNPNSVTNALGKLYKKLTDSTEVMPVNCQWVNDETDKYLRIINYPRPGWDTKVSKYKKNSYRLSFSFKGSEAEELSELFRNENHKYFASLDDSKSEK